MECKVLGVEEKLKAFFIKKNRLWYFLLWNWISNIQFQYFFIQNRMSELWNRIKFIWNCISVIQFQYFFIQNRMFKFWNRIKFIWNCISVIQFQYFFIQNRMFKFWNRIKFIWNLLFLVAQWRIKKYPKAFLISPGYLNSDQFWLFCSLLASVIGKAYLQIVVNSFGSGNITSCCISGRVVKRKRSNIGFATGEHHCIFHIML